MSKPTPQPTSMPADLTDLDASSLSDLIHSRSVSCRDVMQAYLQRIHRVNPVYNAIVNLADDEVLLAQAETFDQELARGQSRGWLHGIPQAIKDIAAATGFPTTIGCRALAGSMATADSLITARVKAAGCIVIGKTNVPEFGLGSHTFNEVFGVTRNGWDPAVSAGGSSGGAAVALVQRLLPVADGSDFMGSLRNPAAWNNVFGLRPSQGAVPMGPMPEAWVSQLSTEGPMARRVRDLGRLLATQAGYDPGVPLSVDLPPAPTDTALAKGSLKGLKVAWLGDLTGHLATEPGILAVCEQALGRLQAAGAIVEPVAPGFDPAEVWECWLVWRRALIAPRVAPLLALPEGRQHVKIEAQWEHDTAQGLSFADFLKASQKRTSFYRRLLKQLARFDVLAMPTVQVWPFPVEQRRPTEIAGRSMDTYHRWMESTIYATLAGLPAISVPAGFHANGRWPTGLQLIGGPRQDLKLLQVAEAYEALIGDLLAQRPAAAA